MKTLKGSKQKEIYEFIKNQIDTKGYPPTIREICKAVGLTSAATVYAQLKKLEKNGYIKRNPVSSRSIEIIKNSSNSEEMIDIPVINNIDDINSILCQENIKKTFPLPANFIENHNELFILKNTDKSMIDINILDGDFSIIERTDFVRNGEIAVVMLDTGVTIIRRFFKENNHIRLQPENSSMKSLIFDNCRIIGKLVGYYRAYY